jgi:hypothetical protein
MPANSCIAGRAGFLLVGGDARFYLFLAVGVSLACVLHTVYMEKYVVGTSKEYDYSFGDLHAHMSSFEVPVRKWGCHRNETPLIFVHIGKAGGGSIRLRFATAALDFDRDPDEWRESGEDNHYYPLPNGQKAKFCNSKNKNHRYGPQGHGPTYEGLLPCNGTTPIGMALACPNAYERPFCLGCKPNGHTCHTVYTGHNHMGAEFHWLPAAYLQNWWNERAHGLLLRMAKSSQLTVTRDSLATLKQGFQALSPTDGTMWCHEGSSRRPLLEDSIVKNYATCGAPLAARIDSVFHELYASADYSPLYASLPVHRVVMVREPWSWLLSKFFWHSNLRWRVDEKGQTRRIYCNDLSDIGYSKQFFLEYLSYLCGDDCEQRLDRGLMTIQQAEIQAANNLRNSFSVVGLLHETDIFFDMVSARIAYVNMSLQSSDQEEQKHSSVSEDSLLCSHIYKTPQFRDRFREVVPLIRTLERLYQLAVHVNREQQKELQECTREN